MFSDSGYTPQELLQQLDDNYAMDNIPTIIFLGLLMITGFVGNILVFFVYLTKMKPSTTRCFILALSFLDFITCCVCIPIEIADFRYNFTFGNFGLIPCKISVLVTFTSFASGNVLLAVAAERYRKICVPTGRQTTIKDAKIAVLVSCVAALIESAPSFVLYGEHKKEIYIQNGSVTATLCTTADEYIDSTFPLINNGLQFAVFVAATITLVVLYTLIWKKIVYFANTKKWSWKFNDPSEDVSYASKQDAETSATRQKGKILDALPSSVDKAEAKRRPSKRQTSARRTTLMLFAITFTFIASYLPHLSLMATREAHWEQIENLSGQTLVAYNVFLRSYYINSAINPFIYSYCNVTARKEIKAIGTFRYCRK